MNTFNPLSKWVFWVFIFLFIGCSSASKKRSAEMEHQDLGEFTLFLVEKLSSSLEDSRISDLTYQVHKDQKSTIRYERDLDDLGDAVCKMTYRADRSLLKNHCKITYYSPKEERPLQEEQIEFETQYNEDGSVYLTSGSQRLVFTETKERISKRMIHSTKERLELNERINIAQLTKPILKLPTVHSLASNRAQTPIE